MSIESNTGTPIEGALADPHVLRAIDVLDRTLSWALRAPSNGERHLEASLLRWTSRAVDGATHGDSFREIHALLVGVDVEDGEARVDRLEQAWTRVRALRATVGPQEPPRLARVRLLPEGVGAERVTQLAPPPPKPVAAVVTADIREEVRQLREESNREEGDGGRTGGAGDGGRTAGAGEGGRPPELPAEARRPDEGRSRGRHERGRREEPRQGRDAARGEEPRREEPREAREPREGRRDEPREARDPREGTRDEPRDGREPREPRRDDPRREPRREEVRPEPPPEVRTWALGHPEHTGVGLAELSVFTPAELAALDTAGVTEVADLLMRAPPRTERAGDRLISGVPPTGNVIVRGQVGGRCTRFVAGTRRYEFTLASDRGGVVCRWSAPSPEIQAIPQGAEIGVAGMWQATEGAAPEEIEGAPVFAGAVYEAEVLGIEGRGGDWLPSYDIPGVEDSRVRAGLRVGLRRYVDGLADHLPAELLERHKLITLAAALRDVHFPSNMSRKGRARLAYDELLQVQLGVALLRQRQGRERGTVNPAMHGLLAQALAMSGWQLTDAQESALDDIRRDLRRPQPMARLLQADAGAGLRDVLTAAMIMVAEGKHQVLVLCPDVLTAEHQFLFAEPLLRNAGIEPVLLTGATRGAQAEAIKKGETLVIFGTHALTADPPAFRRLGLCILEEHGNFGGVDLAKLEEGVRPDLLVVTPTPVPAAVALSVYGHLALTTLPAPPPRVDCAVFTSQQRAEAYATAREAIERKHQVLLVFPLLRGSDLLASSEARRMAETLQETAFPGARISIFHGALSKEERFRAFDDFQHRRADVLLATTQVENGAVMPNASVVLVEHAQEFDIVRLHQLRALVGQGVRPGKCLLILGGEADPTERARLDAFCRETDGWQIAEMVAGQSGARDLPGFTWAEPAKDRELLLRTRQDSVRLLALDPGLKRRVHRALLAQVRTRLGEDVSLDGEVERPVVPGPAGAPAAAQAAALEQSRKKRRRRR